jgi:SprT protein
MAYYGTFTIGLSRHVLTDEERVRETLVHEYAHLLAYAREGKTGAGHGAAWRRAMADLGAPANVRHRYEVRRNARRQRVAYRCRKCGKDFTRARRLPSTRTYVHAACGGALQMLGIEAIDDGRLTIDG